MLTAPTPTERANTHDHAAPILLQAVHAAIPRVKALLGRQGHLLWLIRLHHRHHLNIQHRQGHGRAQEWPSRGCHAISRYCV